MFGMEQEIRDGTGDSGRLGLVLVDEFDIGRL